MILNGTEFRHVSYPKIILEQPYYYDKLSNGNSTVKDLGIAYDRYSSEVTFYDTLDNITNLLNLIESNQTDIPFVQSNKEYLWGNHLDYSLINYVNFTKFGTVRKDNFKLYSLPITLVPNSFVIDANIGQVLHSVNRLASEQQKTGTEFDINTFVSQSNVIKKTTNNNRQGIFETSLQLTHTEFKQTLAYLLKTVRASVFALPPVFYAGIDYPFGANFFDYPYMVRITELKFNQLFPYLWELNLTFNLIK